MRILAVSDTQLGAGKQLADDRLADQEQVLNAIADLAHERDVDVVLHCGDVFEHRHPGEAERMVFKRWAAKVTEHHPKPHLPRSRMVGEMLIVEGGPRLIVLAGNHDLSNTALASAVDLYDRCEFIRSPRVLDLGGCSLACLPWAPIHSLVAGRESTERVGANAQAAEALTAILRGLADQRDGKPMLLAAHWSIEGSCLPSGIPVADLAEPVVPLSALDQFAYTIAGHIHNGGRFAPGAMYCGSPYPCSYGESGPHGCWLFAIDPLEPGADAEFIPISSRRLVTIDCDLTQHDPSQYEPGAETDLIFDGDWDLTDATVRVRYTASEEQHRRVNVPVLKHAILRAGAHKLYSVEPTILRADRERVKGLDETAEPAAALDAWCEASGVDAGKREGLQALLQRYSA